MSNSIKNISFHILLLLCVCFFSFFYRLGARGLTDPDEGRYAEAAREMIAKRDFITPWLNDEPRLQKPILIYWLIIGSYKLVGINELGARLPSAIAGTGTVLVLYFLCRALFNPLIGLLAGIIFALSPLTSALARISNTDMTLTFFITAALASFATVYFLQRTEYLLFFHLALALATLTKGYVGFFIPLVIIFLFLLSVRQLKFYKQLKLLQGLLIFLLINLPWYLMIILIHKEVLRYYLVEEGLQRFFTTHHERQQPVYYYVLLIIPAFFPWSLFLLDAFIKQLNLGLKNLASQFPRQFYFFIWYIAGLGVFSLSGSKLPTYIMPIFPALALTTALWCYANFFSRKEESFSFYKSLPTIIKVLLLIIFLVGLGLIITGIVVTARYSLRTPLASIGGGFFTIAVFCAFLWRQHKPAWTFYSLTTGLVLLVIFLLPALDEIITMRRSTRHISKLASGHIEPTDKIYFVESNVPSSALFYLRRPIQKIKNRAELSNLLREGKNVILFIERNEEDKYRAILKPLRKVAQDREFYVFTNKKD